MRDSSAKKTAEPAFQKKKRIPPSSERVTRLTPAKIALKGRLLATRERPSNAQVAELVDALVSGTSDASRGGSSPLLGTKRFNKRYPARTSTKSWSSRLPVGPNGWMNSSWNVASSRKPTDTRFQAHRGIMRNSAPW